MINLFKKVKYAIDGLKYCIESETSFQLECSIVIVVLLCGLTFSLSFVEWAFILLFIGLILVCEIFNSCLERLCNLFSSGWLLTEIKIIKDMAAGAVLIFSIISFIVGCIIFIPKLFL